MLRAVSAGLRQEHQLDRSRTPTEHERLLTSVRASIRTRRHIRSGYSDRVRHHLLVHLHIPHRLGRSHTRQCEIARAVVAGP